MKKTTLFTMLAMLFLLVGSGKVWADELFYTLLTVPNATGSNHTNYNEYYDDEHDGIVWNAPGNQSLPDIWRIGGKSLDKVDRTITSKTPMGSSISSVIVNHKGISRASVTVNSMKLTVASDVDYTNIIDEIVLTPTISTGVEGNVEFVPESVTVWDSEAYYRLTINLSNSTSNNGGIDLTSIEFYAPGESGTVTVAKPVITPDGGTFSEPQEVTITAGEGCTIYYTLDGSDPTDASTQYTAPITISESCTVKAIAYNDDDNASKVVSADFTFITTPTVQSIAELCTLATNEDQSVPVHFNEWIVTGVNGAQLYFTDGVNGIVGYQSGHNFETGDKITGTAVVTLVLYNDCAEVKGLTSATEGVTVEKGAVAVPQSVSIASLQKDMQGCLIHFDGMTYADGVFVDDDDNTITPYNTFRLSNYPTLIEGKTYNVTGVAIWYAKDAVWQIAPRTADEFELITSQVTPESSWSVAAESVDINGEATAVFTTNSDGAVSYASSDETVATVDGNGRITLLGRGITVITANVAETETYFADSKSFTLTVTELGFEDVLFQFNDEDIVGQGAPDTGAELTATRNGKVTLYANKAYAKPGDTHIKFYGSKYEGEEEERAITEASYIKLSVPSDYVITDIVLTATGESYIKEWLDQDGNAAAINGVTATWNGSRREVILTNQATAQARIKTIRVTFVSVNEDGICSVKVTADGDAAIYNLAGQRLVKMQRGINIVDGKKVLR